MSKLTELGLSRREFLVRSATAGAGAYMSIGMGTMLANGKAEAAAPANGYTPSIWFTITPDNKVTMHIVKAEMGQHIGTGLAQVIAEELEVRWEDVRLDTPMESLHREQRQYDYRI